MAQMHIRIGIHPRPTGRRKASHAARSHRNTGDSTVFRTLKPARKTVLCNQGLPPRAARAEITHAPVTENLFFRYVKDHPARACQTCGRQAPRAASRQALSRDGVADREPHRARAPAVLGNCSQRAVARAGSCQVSGPACDAARAREERPVAARNILSKPPRRRPARSDRWSRTAHEGTSAGRAPARPWCRDPAGYIAFRHEPEGSVGAPPGAG